jgi:DNA mismatch endonuclease, patch repair protein
MSRVRSADTRPEMLVRSMLHSLGYRYRLHARHLPGTPDMVFPAREKVLFINGCFWHGHSCRMGRALPKTNVEFWRQKIQRNTERDRQNIAVLRRMGWGVAVVWECELKKSDRWVSRILRFLG